MLALFDFDLANPFYSYLILVFIALIIRIFLVILPIFKLLLLAANPAVQESLLKFKKLSSINLGLKRFTIIEICLMLIPLVLCMIIRLLFGKPELINWNIYQIIVAILIGSMWLAVDVIRSLNVRNSLKKFEKWYSNPELVDIEVGKLVWSRSLLDYYSKGGSSEVQKETIVREEELENDISMPQKLVTKVSEGLLWARRKSAEKVAEKFDEYAQNKVDKALHSKERNANRLNTLALDLVLGFFPLIIIYLMLPFVGV